MLDSAIEPTVAMEFNEGPTHRRVIMSNMTLSESGPASSFPSEVFSKPVVSISSRASSIIGSAELPNAPDEAECVNSQAAELDSDIRSVMSDLNDIHSLASNRRMPQEIVAEEHLGVLLAQRSELKPLYEEALQKLGRSRFVENFRRLLKRYYLDLSRHANTNLQRATTHLLRSRWARIRIAQRVVDFFHAEDKDAEAQMAQFIRENQWKVLDLESWIATNEGLAPSMDDLDDTIMCEDSSDDDSNTGEDKASILPNVSEMEEFLVGGVSFQNLSVNMQLFLLPAALAPLTRIIMSIPEENIWFSAEDDLSFMNQTKIWLENRTVGKWNWWPMQPPMPLLQEDQVRVHWQCVRFNPPHIAYSAF